MVPLLTVSSATTFKKLMKKSQISLVTVQKVTHGVNKYPRTRLTFVPVRVFWSNWCSLSPFNRLTHSRTFAAWPNKQIPARVLEGRPGCFETWFLFGRTFKELMHLWPIFCYSSIRLKILFYIKLFSLDYISYSNEIIVLKRIK